MTSIVNIRRGTLESGVTYFFDFFPSFPEILSVSISRSFLLFFFSVSFVFFFRSLSFLSVSPDTRNRPPRRYAIR